MKQNFLFTIKMSSLENTTKKYLEFKSYQKTQISDLKNDNYINNISYTDETKKIKNCNISFIDFKSKKEIDYKNYNCFWCRNKFPGNGLGCPIKFKSPSVTKEYKSNISKNTYIINENITNEKINNINENDNYTINNNTIYETYGIFCSFNCCLAFIKDNKHNDIYNNSEFLLYQLYNNNNIIPAPHWTLLSDYGGKLSIEEFRKNFNNMQYNYIGNIKNIVIVPLISLFEENIKI